MSEKADGGRLSVVGCGLSEGHPRTPKTENREPNTPAGYVGTLKAELAANRAFYALFAVFAVTGFLFIRPAFTTPDSACYFAFVRSAVMDGDFQFANEYERWQVPGFWNEPTGTGYVTNASAVGSAALWLPFFLLGHGLTLLANATGAGLRADGYSELYILLAHVGSCLYGLVGLLLSYEVAKDYFSPRASLAAALFVWFATPFLFYFYFLGTYAHVNGAATVALFLYVWHKTRRDRRAWHWALWGLAAGLMTLVRWQNVLLCVVAAGEVVRDLRGGKSAGRAARDALAFGAMALLAFLPQMLVWQTIYGTPLLIPNKFSRAAAWGPAVISWFRPAVLKTLFSPHHGLYSWTPIFLLCTVGFVRLWQRERFLAGALLAAFALQIYMNSIVDWWGGWSFGVRRITDATLISVVTLAALLDCAGAPSRRAAVYAVAALCTAWSLLLALQLVSRVTEGELAVGWGTIIGHQAVVVQQFPSIVRRGFVEVPMARRDLLWLVCPVLLLVSFALLRTAQGVISSGWLIKSKAPGAVLAAYMILIVVLTALIGCKPPPTGAIAP